MANAINPYGDGRAAERAVAALAHYFGLGPGRRRVRQHARADGRPRPPRAGGGVNHAKPAGADGPTNEWKARK